MAMQMTAGAVLYTPLSGQPAWSPTASNVTIDATGESIFIVGHIRLSTGPGTSKTLDTSGKIHWRTGTATFANAGTTLRVGIQDITAAGLNDDVWTGEPQADLVGGTDTIAAPAVISTVVESGSRLITHGDQLCIGAELITRAGADAIMIPRIQSIAATTAHTVTDTGGGPTFTTFYAPFVVEFGDGTIGYMQPGIVPHILDTATLFGSGSTPDEWALVARWPYTFSATGLFAMVTNVVSTDDFELILYSDPLGTPVAERTLVFDMSLYAFGGGISRPFTSAYTILPNTDYGIALRPTVAGTIAFDRLNFGTSNGNLRGATTLGTNWSMYARTDQTGAFGSQDTTILPAFGIFAGGFDDGVTGGGGGLNVVGGRGGVIQ